MEARTSRADYTRAGTFEMTVIAGDVSVWAAKSNTGTTYLRRFVSIRSQIMAATSGPPKFLTARMPVGEVTLISVR